MLPPPRRARPIDPPELPTFNLKATMLGLVRRLKKAPTPAALRTCGRWPAAGRVTPMAPRRR